LDGQALAPLLTACFGPSVLAASPTPATQGYCHRQQSIARPPAHCPHELSGPYVESVLSRLPNRPGPRADRGRPRHSRSGTDGSPRAARAHRLAGPGGDRRRLVLPTVDVPVGTGGGDSRLLVNEKQGMLYRDLQLLCDPP
jgi:hypothetical protein